jgi:putative transposase
MPINAKYIEPFVENEFMHIYCKAAGNNILFRNDENRLWFLKKYAAYANGYFETYSYTLSIQLIYQK